MVTLKQASILVVDDSPTTRRIVSGMLESLGVVHVEEADSGEAAVSKIHAGHYTLIISDWNMAPMAGPTLLRAVLRRQKPRSNRFIFMTTEGSWGHRTTARIDGADDFLVKPFPISLLKEKIEKVLARV